MDKTTETPSTVYFTSHKKYDDLSHEGRAHIICNYNKIHSFSSLTCSSDKHGKCETSVEYSDYNGEYRDLNDALPFYNYKITISDTNGIINEGDIIPEDISLKLQNILELELPRNNQDIIDNIDEEQQSNYILRRMEEVFGEERAHRILITVGIQGINYEGTNTVIIFDDRLIKKVECKTSFIPRRFKGEFDRRIKQGIEYNSHFSASSLFLEILNRNNYGFNYLLLHALEHHEEVRDICFETLSEIKGYDDDRVIFDRLVQESIDKLHKSSALRQEFNSVAVKSSMPKTRKELRKLKPATSNDVPERQILDLGGNTKSAYLKIRPSDKAVFVIKKSGSTESCKAEHEAYQIYNAFKVKTPKSSLITIKEDKKEKNFLVLEYIHGETIHEISEKKASKNNVEQLCDLRKKIAHDFPIDALIGNYDAGSLHLGNIMHSFDDDEIYRIDPGAALQFNHEGKEKTTGNQPRQWGNSINDFFHLRSSYSSFGSDNCLKNYGGITNQEILERLKEAETCMDKVKKVASPKNYAIISTRLTKALVHFDKLCELEKSFKQVKLDTTKPIKIKQVPVRKQKISALKIS